MFVAAINYKKKTFLLGKKKNHYNVSATREMYLVKI